MFAKSLFAAAAFAISANAALTISTPTELKQCEEATFVISGAQGAIFPFVVDPAAPCEDALLELDETTGNLKWSPKLPVGTSIMVAIEDETGAEAFTGALTITAGASAACTTKEEENEDEEKGSSSSSSEPPRNTISTNNNNNSNNNNNNANNNGVANAADGPTDYNTVGSAPRTVALGGAAVAVVFSALALVL